MPRLPASVIDEILDMHARPRKELGGLSARQVAVRDAVSAWHRARLGRNLSSAVTGRTDAENAVLRRRAGAGLDRILAEKNTKVKPGERDVLERARSAIQTIFDAPVKAAHRPSERAAGWRHLVQYVNQLRLCKVPARRAIAFVVSGLLHEHPPNRRNAWLYQFRNGRTADPQGNVEDSLRQYMKLVKKSAKPR